MFNKLLTLTS